MVDVICDPEIQPFSDALGMKRWSGMVQRNYDAQSGTPESDGGGSR